MKGDVEVGEEVNIQRHELTSVLNSSRRKSTTKVKKYKYKMYVKRLRNMSKAFRFPN